MFGFFFFTLMLLKLSQRIRRQRQRTFCAFLSHTAKHAENLGVLISCSRTAQRSSSLGFQVGASQGFLQLRKEPKSHHDSVGVEEIRERGAFDGTDRRHARAEPGSGSGVARSLSRSRLDPAGREAVHSTIQYMRKQCERLSRIKVNGKYVYLIKHQTILVYIFVNLASIQR